MDKKIPDSELQWVATQNGWVMTHPETLRRAYMAVWGDKCHLELAGIAFPVVIKRIGHTAALRRARQHLRADISRLSAE